MAYLEMSLGDKKAELETERTQNTSKIIEMQTELQQLRSTSKVNEERAKLIEADKQRCEQQYTI